MRTFSIIYFLVSVSAALVFGGTSPIPMLANLILSVGLLRRYARDWFI